MKVVLIIALSGALGALARYAMVNAIGGKYFPWGTLAVNVLGSLIMGFAFIMIAERQSWPAELKPLIMTGFLGAFTTFSAFSLEAWELLDRGEGLHALAYVLVSVVACVLAVTLGVFAARASL
ncbi:MAG: fluoride efflux transporter CrcB [Oleiphilaceae bacterium]|nr:fluoride efflux transporter CrcB [Oleiphilaceae bacterium]